MEIGERKAVVSGVGQSQIGRRIYRDPIDLTLDACLAAIEDAGLTRDDIDGLATYPGNMSVPPGFSGGGITTSRPPISTRSGNCSRSERSSSIWNSASRTVSCGTTQAPLSSTSGPGSTSPSAAPVRFSRWALTCSAMNFRATSITVAEFYACDPPLTNPSARG